MASLPEDDGPTMSGLPEERRPAVVRDPDADDGDDTTSAEAGPPASQSDPPAHDEEDRTVQQKVSPPQPARKPAISPAPDPPLVARLKTPTPAPVSVAPPRPPSRPGSSPVLPTGPSSSPGGVSSAIPSTEPAGAAPPSVQAPMTTASATEAGEIAEDLADDLIDDEDDEPIEDSITATAPRIDADNMPITVLGAVEIRTLDDDMNDETEVRTRPGHVPLAIPATLRAAPAPPAQPPAQLPAPRPAAGRPPSMLPPTEISGADDDDEDGPTTEGPAPRVGSVPDLGGPATTLSSVSSGPASELAATTRPGVRGPLATDTQAEAELATRPGVEGAVEAADELLTRPGVEGADPPTRPGLEPETSPGLGAQDAATAKRKLDVNSYANEDDEDESVTTRGPAYVEDSVTTQAPAVPPSLAAAASVIGEAALDDDGSEGTTQKVKRARIAASSSPADGEVESITTQAPGGLTNILRVIASGSSPNLDDVAPIDEDDEGPENRTAVMANAPLKKIINDAASASSLPAIRPTGGPLTHHPQGVAAPQLTPSSESGLRVARGSGSGERVSIGGLGAAADARNSGIVGTANALASDGSISAPIDIRAHANTELAFPNPQPSLHDVDLGSSGPRYGLLVAIVAVISIIVPVTLFAVLRHGPDAPAPAVASEPVSEIETPTPARLKKPGKGSPTVAPSASASASGSASAGKPNVPPRGFPFKR